MVKPQLIEYIGQQLEQGFSFDAIGDALLSQGWEIEEIQEAFAAFEYKEVEEDINAVTPFKKILEILGLPTGKLASTLIIILLGLLTFFVLFALSFGSVFYKSEVSSDNIENQQLDDNPLSIKNTSTNEFTKDDIDIVEETLYESYEQDENEVSSTVEESPEVLSDGINREGNCLYDFDCFMEASQNCDDASVRASSEKNGLEGLILLEKNYEITQSSDGGCVFTTILDKSNLASDEPLLGKKSVCVYADYKELTNYLESLKEDKNLSYSYDSEKSVSEYQAEISGASYCYGPFFDELEDQLSF